MNRPLIGPMNQPMCGLFQLRCPARAVFGRGDAPRCDLCYLHPGPHVAERGMGADEVWTEVRS